LEKLCAMAFKLHFPSCPLPRGADRGLKLLNWTQETVIAVPPILPEPKPKRKYSLLPVLIVLFLISYGLMSLLAVEQDRTIASQRSLITSLLGDSTELSHLKGRILQEHHTQAEPGSGGSPAQIPSAQAPMTQDTPGGNVPSSHNAGKVRKPVPARPPLGLSDIVDGRRIVEKI
jgi:hypothetical protein